MKNRNAFKMLIIPLLLSLFFVGCKKDDEAVLEQISEKVRASLEGEIVFSKDLSIYKSNAKSGGSGSLIGTNADGLIGAKWSPDGSKIAYIKRNGGEGKWYLVVRDKYGLEVHEWLLFIDPFNGIHGITWSPDGNTIAALDFDGTKIHYFEVATGKLTTTELITRSGYSYKSIAWWPKGNKIAIAEGRSYFFSNSDENEYIWMLEAFENNPQSNPSNLLITNRDLQLVRIEHMNWSMDGSKLVYSGNGFVYIANSDGTNNQEIILKGHDKDKKLQGSTPCWMLNNKQIIFVSITGYNYNDFTYILGLFVTDINGSYKVDLKIPGEYPDCY